jgi:hypothetical protein
MPLPLEQFLNRLASLTDPSLLCEVLDISTEDILERFEDLIEDNLDVLREAYDIDITFEETDDE